MARTVNEIKKSLYAELTNQQALGNLTGLNSPSMTAIYKCFFFIIAVTTALEEQILDVSYSNTQALVARNVYCTNQWIQYIVTIFQYDTVNAQVVQVNPDFSINYPTTITADQVVNNCSVTTGNSGLVSIKVATGNPPQPLDGATGTSGLICTELIAYLDNILAPDIRYQLINQLPDILYLNATVYYDGQLSGVVQPNVIAALNNYIASFTGVEFNGEVKLDDMRTVIKSVTGVNDVVFNNVTLTPNGGTAQNLVLANTVVNREITAYAGYINNAASPNDFAHKISFEIG